MQLSRRRGPTASGNAGASAAGKSGVGLSHGSDSSSAGGGAGGDTIQLVQNRLHVYRPIYLTSLQRGDAMRIPTIPEVRSRGNSVIVDDDNHVDGSVAAAAAASSYIAGAELFRFPENLYYRAKTKTMHALLLVCLHIGSDPPDYPRIDPCSKLECWMDPYVSRFSLKGSSETIAEALEKQYRMLHHEAHYRKGVESNIEDARQQLMSTRRKARDGRVLIHYNGHGMPRATHLGEIWFFDKDRTHYVPLNISEIAQLADSPSIYVLDCNSAGSIIQHWTHERLHQSRKKDMFLCACSAGEVLPLDPLLPADLLTSCLTTPLKMALEWYIGFSHRRVLLPNVTEEMIRNIPGDLSERKSPLGELNWILIAITHTIAWCTSTPTQFFILFRQDTLAKSLFRNFLLADYIMREAGCTPTSHPAISDAAHVHHLWAVWEMTVEHVITQLPKMLKEDLTVDPQYVYKPSTFFLDQLAAFEVWVEMGNPYELPEQLPCVLLALAQISYRIPALTLISRYLDSSPIAGKRAILCGLLPYMCKLLVQTPDVIFIVCCLWMQVVRADPKHGCTELIKNQADKHFIRILSIDPATVSIIRPQSLQTLMASMIQSPTGRNGITRQTTLNNSASNDDSTSSGFPKTSAQQQQQQNFRQFPGSRSAQLDSQQGQDGGDGGEDGSQPIQPLRTFSTASGDGGSSLGNRNRISDEPRTGSNRRGSRLSASPSGHAIDADGEEEDIVQSYYALNNIDLERCKTMSCYVLVQMMDFGGEKQCISMWNNQLLKVAFSQLSSSNEELRSWSSLVLAKLFVSLRHAKEFACKEYNSRIDLFSGLLGDRSPIVRSSGVTLLATLLGSRIDLMPAEQQIRRTQMEKTLLIKLREYLFDPSMAVRQELIFAACHVMWYYSALIPGCLEWNHILDHQGKRWALTEAEVQVKSLLHSARPTINIRFDDSVVFNTSFIGHDDPIPSQPWDASKLVDIALETIQSLVHDASLMLVLLYANCDTQKVKEAVAGMAQSEPRSFRFAEEGHRTMRTVVSQESQHILSEADRGRKTRNNDSMRKLVLDLHERQFEPLAVLEQQLQQQNSSPSLAMRKGAGLVTLPVGGAVADRTSPGLGFTSNLAELAERRLQFMPGVIAADTVMSVAFRLLEPEFFVADTRKRISLVSYDSFEAQTVVRSLVHCRPAPLHDLLLVNDLAENYGVLAVDTDGGFTLYRGSAWSDASSSSGNNNSSTSQDSSSSFSEVASFSACPPRGPIDLHSAYRASDGVLIYGGPIGVVSSVTTTELHLLSLAEEQVVQKIAVSGDAQLTALAVNTIATAVLTGTSDGVVRYYDDRQKQSSLAAVSLLQRRGANVVTEPIVGLSVYESSALCVASATRSCISLFDVRRPTEPFLIVEAQKLMNPARGEVKAGSPSQPGMLGAPMISSFSGSLHAPLFNVGFSDGSFDVINRRGQSILLAPKKVAAEPRAFMKRRWCVAHAMRPMFSVAGNLTLIN